MGWGNGGGLLAGWARVAKPGGGGAGGRSRLVQKRNWRANVSSQRTEARQTRRTTNSQKRSRVLSNRGPATRVTPQTNVPNV